MHTSCSTQHTGTCKFTEWAVAALVIFACVTTVVVIAVVIGVEAAAVAVAAIDAADVIDMDCGKLCWTVPNSKCDTVHQAKLQACDGKGEYALSRSDPRQ